MERVVIVGVTGSGKTTLAREVARRLNAPHVELDALHWEPNWTMAEAHVFRARVAEVVCAERWVVDGNYSRVRDLVWGRADTLVWLDYAFAVIAARLLRRTIQRVRSQEELWNGNRERFSTQFLSRESLFLWALQTYPRHRAELPKLVREQAYGHLTVVRLRTPRAARGWLEAL